MRISDGSSDVFSSDLGHSATAVHAHAVALLRRTASRLPGWNLAPVVFAQQSRVALGDEIGEALGAAQVVMLIGERPGLSAADSLGAYLTWDPRPGRLDSARNCKLGNAPCRERVCPYV